MTYTGTVLSMDQAAWHQCPTWFNYKTQKTAFKWLNKQASDGKFSFVEAGGYGPGRFLFEREADCMLFSLKFAGTDKEWM